MKKPGYDPTLLILPVLLCVFGLLMQYCAVGQSQNFRKVWVQGLAFILGLLLCLFLARLDFRGAKSYATHLFVVSVALFLLVLAAGTKIGGAKSWLRFFGIGIQPAEVAKVAYAVVLAAALTREDREKPPLLRFSSRLLPVGAFMGLIILQNDTGTALVYGVMALFMIFAAGVKIRHLLYGGFGILAAIPICWSLLAPYQKNRILVFFNPEKDPLGAGYQVMRAKMTAASGELFGRGFLRAPQTHFGRLPEAETDFIFSVIGETFGFIGCILVAGLLFFLCLRLLFVARRAKDRFGKLLATGIFAMFFTHTAENIGMCIGLLPVTGIPLPFFSYGGSFMVTCFLALGMVLSIDKTEKSLYF